MKIFCALVVGIVFTAFPLFAQEEQVKPAEPQVQDQKEQPAAAEQKKEPGKPVVELKELEGQISGISGNFIAVSYGISEEAGLESAFNVAKNVQLSHVRSFKDLKFGDTVRIRFEQETRKLDNGRVLKKKTVKSITFLKSAPKELVSQEPSASSGDSETPLSLKGTKGR